MHAPSLAIIGAGPSGLALGLFLEKPCDILEAQSHVGGHTSSLVSQGFTFDYGPHILFSRDKPILDFVVATLGDNVSLCRRNNKVSFKNRLIKYPFENDLNSLALEDNYECIHHFLFNPYKEQYVLPVNMKEWFLKTFGEGICSRYLFPYNEKVWNIPIEQLSMSLADRIPNPPPEDILKSALGYNTEGYVHQLYYHYPKTGGYQAICESWKKALTVRYQFKVDKIQWINGKIRLINTQGETKDYSEIVSTMPIHELIDKIDIPLPEAIQQAIDQLIINPMILISFGVKGIDPNQYTAVYFPEPEFLVNRISYPCTFSENNGPKEHWSLQAEITCAKGADTWKLSDAEILEHTKQNLQLRNLLPSDGQIVLSRVDRVPHAYVVYDLNYEENANKVRSWCASKGIHLLGRFSYFEYVNVDMAVARAIQVAATLNNDMMDDTTKTRYLARALDKLTGTVACQI